MGNLFSGKRDGRAMISTTTLKAIKSPESMNFIAIPPLFAKYTSRAPLSY
jgi:hypothetical protein